MGGESQPGGADPTAFFATLKALTLDANFSLISKVVDDNENLKKIIKTKDDEVAQLKKAIENMGERRRIAIEEICETNQTGLKKQAALSERIQSLEAEVKQRDDTIAEKNKAVDASAKGLQECQQLLTQEQTKVEKANADITELEKKMKEKDSLVDQMKEAGKSLKRRTSVLEDKLSESKKTNVSLEEQLKDKSARLQELEGFAAPYKVEDESSMMDKMDNLWSTACTTVMPYFLNEDLPEEAFQGQQALRKLKEPNILHHRVPLPHSNSNAAKQMRCSVILGIIAREIDQHIFQPTYLLGDDSGIRDFLVSLAMVDNKKESFCRALLRSIEPDTQTRNAEERIKQVIDNVAWYISELLPKDRHERFLQDLVQVVRLACDIAKMMQRTRDKYEPDFDPEHFGDFYWDPLPFFEHEATANGEGEVDGPLLVVFPRMCLIKDKERLPLDSATVLRRSQSATAERESKRKDSASPTAGRPGPARQRTRRMSFGIIGRNGENKHLIQQAIASMAQTTG